MTGCNHPICGATSIRLRSYALGAVSAVLLLIGCLTAAEAQEPPLSVPKNALPTTPGDALALGGWLFYPTINIYSQYSDNLFQTVLNPISIWGFGVKPSMIAEWSNGIHTTQLYGNIEGRKYITDNELNIFDRQAGFIQKYEALRDLTFTAQADYSHHTYSSVTTALPNGVSTPGTTTVLPNGNTVLPNGNIISPTGQLVGQAAPTLNVTGSQTLINPSNIYTGTASVEKILNRGFIGLSGSIARTEYEDTNISPDITAKSLTGTASFWLGPVFYVYTNDSYATQASLTDSSAYRVIGGIGTRQIGLFRASSYYGHQGTYVQNSGTAGGEVYGGNLTYYPTRIWTLGVNIDETVNISNQNGVTTIALNNQSPSALSIPVSSSTRITAISLNSSYLLSVQWSVYGNFGFTHAEYIDSPRVDNSWLADVAFQYQMWRNMTLKWEYLYSSIVSNTPLNSSRQNFVSMGATYKF
jgi:putative beta-barrel porin BBP2